MEEREKVEQRINYRNKEKRRERKNLLCNAITVATAAIIPHNKEEREKVG